MSTFVSTTEDGYINLDLVASARPITTREGYRQTVFLAASGEVLGRSYGHLDLEVLTAPVVPAEPGAVVVIISICSEGRPGPDDVAVWRMPVIAWRVGPMSPVTPVCIEEIFSENETWLLPLSSGELLSQDEIIFGSIEQAADNTLLRAQTAWDSRRLKSA